MIEINLLPEELRVGEKSITGMRLLLFLGIPFLCILVYFWIWLHFFEYREAEDKLNELSAKEKQLKKKAEKVHKLEDQLKKMKKKERTIKKLKGLQRVDWLKKMMELTQVVRPTQGWLTSVKFNISGGKGTLRIGCSVKGRDDNEVKKNVLDFLNFLGYRNGDREAGEPSDFWKNFINHTPDFYYRGSAIKEKGVWKMTSFNLPLEIKHEVVSNIDIQGK